MRVMWLWSLFGSTLYNMAGKHVFSGQWSDMCPRIGYHIMGEGSLGRNTCIEAMDKAS